VACDPCPHFLIAGKRVASLTMASTLITYAAGYLLVALPRSISSQKVYGMTGETSRLHSSTHSLSPFAAENKLTAAKLVGIGKTTLYRKLKGYGSTQEVSPNG